MRRFFARLLLFVGLLLIGVVGVINSLPPHDPTYYNDLQALLFSPACRGFTGACWLGVRVGETTAVEAERILSAHPWVAEIQDDWIYTAALIVRWKPDAPSFLGRGARAAVISFNTDLGIVHHIELQVSIPMADFWALAGRPQTLGGQAPILNVTYPPPATPGGPSITRPTTLNLGEISTLYNGYYPLARVSARISVDCPQNPQRFWNGTVESLSYFSTAAPTPYESRLDWGRIYDERLCTPIIVST